jgi:hypothetical protein
VYKKSDNITKEFPCQTNNKAAQNKQPRSSETSQIMPIRMPPLEARKQIEDIQESPLVLSVEISKSRG